MEWKGMDLMGEDFGLGCSGLWVVDCGSLWIRRLCTSIYLIIY